MPRWMWTVVAVFGCIVMLVVPIALNNRLVGAQADLATARKSAAAARVQADHAVQESVAIAARADSLTRKSRVDSARADSLQQRYSVARSKLLVAIPAASDSCAEVVQLSLDALVAADSTLAAQSEATASAQEAARQYKLRGDTLEAALTRLRPADATLDVAAGHVASAAHASLLSRLLPHPGFGVSYGVDPLGQPHIVYGIQLGWSF